MTMYRVLITFAERPTKDYPLAVVVIKPDGKRLQDHQIRSVRDGRILGNGICYAAMILTPPESRDWPVNPEVDPRLIEGPGAA